MRTVLAALLKGIHLSALSPLIATGQAASSQKPLGRTQSSPFTKDFRDFVSKTLEEWHVPGVAMAVIDGDDIWTQGFGIAEYPDKPVTTDTLFYGASTTKAFVAAQLSLLIDSNNYTELSPGPHRSPGQTLDWTSPISSLIRDDFVLQDAWATEKLTLQDALSHRTGMPRHDGAWAREYGGRQATVRDIVRQLRHLTPNAEPRTTWQYCNGMWVVLSHVIETLTGRWLGDVLRESIWEPLGMQATFFSLEDAQAAPEHFAAGYYWDKSAEEYKQVPYMPLQEVSGAGAVISNVKDYAKWVQCLLKEGKPFSEAGLAAVKAPRMITSTEAGAFDSPQLYASGWFTTSYKGHRFWTHSGGMHAYSTQVWFWPEKKYGIVTFGNTAMTASYVGKLLMWQLTHEKLGIAHEDRVDWNSTFRSEVHRAHEKVDAALDVLYPGRVLPPLPPTRPLRDYVGTYFNPGYQNMTIELASESEKGHEGPIHFTVRRERFTWPTEIRFEHVSGDYYFMHIDFIQEKSGNMREVARARFDVAPDGRAKSLIVDFIDLNEENMVQGTFVFAKTS